MLFLNSKPSWIPNFFSMGLFIFSGFSVGFCINGGRSNPHRLLTSNDVYPQQCMAINSNVCSHLFTFAMMTTGAFSRMSASYFLS